MQEQSELSTDYNLKDIVNVSKFCKPSKNSEVIGSRHVYITGLGHQLGTSVSYIHSLFSAFGELDADNPVELVRDKRYCYISYKQLSSAKLLMDFYLNDVTINSSIDLSIICKLQVKFACLSSEQIAGPSQIDPEDVCETDHINIPGLIVIKDFISEDEQEMILASEIGDEKSSRWEELLSRKIQHYGLIFNYRTLMLDYMTNIPPMPQSIQGIINRIENEIKNTQPYKESEVFPDPLLQLTVNEYTAGQGIASHIDTDSCLGPDIGILSLLSDVVMAFQERRPTDPDLAKTVTYSPSPAIVAKTILPRSDVNDYNSSDSDTDINEEIVPKLEVVGSGCTTTSKRYTRRKYVHIPSRSLLLLQGEARYNWSHGIAPRKCDKVNGQIIPRQKRISLTFRQIMFPGDVPQTRLQSSHIEVDHVFRVYDSIAVHWNHTRGRRKVHWHRVKDFIEGLPIGTLVADIGSGDGKYFGLNSATTTIGCDRSLKLLEVSHESSHNTFCCDAVKLPLRSCVFDATLCIAVMHHLASLDRRIALIRELLRITRVGGEVMIQAWALEQGEDSRWDFQGLKSQPISKTSASKTSTVDVANKSSGCPQQDVLVPWKLQKRFFTEDQIQQANSDDLSIDCEHVVKEQDGSLLFQRYCHVYKAGELEDLCSSCPGNKILESGWDKGNWFVRLLKTDTHEEPILNNVSIGPTGIMPRLATRL